MSRAKTGMGMKKIIEKVVHGKLRCIIPAGMAAAGPPLGPQLGQVLVTYLLFHTLITYLTRTYLLLLKYSYLVSPEHPQLSVA